LISRWEHLKDSLVIAGHDGEPRKGKKKGRRRQEKVIFQTVALSRSHEMQHKDQRSKRKQARGGDVGRKDEEGERAKIRSSTKDCLTSEERRLDRSKSRLREKRRWRKEHLWEGWAFLKEELFKEERRE